jgi:hypothetical protein
MVARIEKMFPELYAPSLIAGPPFVVGRIATLRAERRPELFEQNDSSTWKTAGPCYRKKPP